jgi:hypothetical protein
MVTHAYDPGRPGPPLFLGILVFILGPIFALVMMGRAAITSLDLANTGPVTNHGRVALNADATYLIATEAVQPGTETCKVRQRNGEAVTVDASKPETVMWGNEAFIAQGGFYLEENGVYVVNCPKAGPQVLLIPIKGSIKEFGWAMGRWILAGGLLAVMGLLMIIFRRKKPKEIRAYVGAGVGYVPGPPAPPGPYDQPGSYDQPQPPYSPGP